MAFAFDVMLKLLYFEFGIQAEMLAGGLVRVPCEGWHHLGLFVGAFLTAFFGKCEAVVVGRACDGAFRGYLGAVYAEEGGFCLSVYSIVFYCLLRSNLRGVALC